MAIRKHKQSRVKWEFGHVRFVARIGVHTLFVWPCAARDDSRWWWEVRRHEPGAGFFTRMGFGDCASANAAKGAATRAARGDF